jgi:spore coat polysaccharide biosynthesis protein SpsF
MADLMVGMDMAIATFGVTAYELAAMGVPAIYLCHTADDVIAAQALVNAVVGVSLGRHEQVTQAQIFIAVTGLLADAKQCAKMSAAGVNLGLGDGARNVAQTIANAVTSKALKAD